MNVGAAVGDGVGQPDPRLRSDVAGPSASQTLVAVFQPQCCRVQSLEHVCVEHATHTLHMHGHNVWIRSRVHEARAVLSAHNTLSGAPLRRHCVGEVVGASDGVAVGVDVGCAEGEADGDDVGIADGTALGD